MGWAFEFRRTDGRALKIIRMNPNITDLAFLLAGIKPVLYTHVERKDVAWMRTLARFFDLEAVFHERSAAGSGNDLELFLGRDSGALRRAVELGKRGAKREVDPEWGALLGYPPCCTRAYAGYATRRAAEERDLVPSIYRKSAPRSAPFSLNNVLNFSTRLNGSPKELDLSRRLAQLNRREEGPSLYMMHVLPWHPCRYDCRPSTSLGRRGWSFMESLLPEFARRMRDILSKPVLYFDKWRFAILDGSCASRRSCEYRAVSGPRSLLPRRWEELIKRGDSVRLTGGVVEVRKGGRPIGKIPSRQAILLPFGDAL
jgi:hypothetical protein